MALVRLLFWPLEKEEQSHRLWAVTQKASLERAGAHPVGIGEPMGGRQSDSAILLPRPPSPFLVILMQDPQAAPGRGRGASPHRSTCWKPPDPSRAMGDRGGKNRAMGFVECEDFECLYLKEQCYSSRSKLNTKNRKRGCW